MFLRSVQPRRLQPTAPPEPAWDLAVSKTKDTNIDPQNSRDLEPRPPNTFSFNLMVLVLWYLKSYGG